MSSNSIISKKIKNTFETISEQFSKTEDLTFWKNYPGSIDSILLDKESNIRIMDVFSLGYSFFSEKRQRDIIIIPNLTKIDYEKVKGIKAQLIEKEIININNDRFYFIDCYGRGELPGWKDINILSPDGLWQKLIDTESYYDYIKKYDSNIVRPLNEFVNRRIFVRDENEACDAISYLNKWASDNTDNENLILVGERGIGKTWLLRMFQAKQMEKHCQSSWLVPAVFFISLKEYAYYLKKKKGLPRTLSYYIYEKEKIKSIGGPPIFEGLISSQRILLLIDALDELSKEVTEYEFEALVNELLDNLPQQAKIIITTRETKFSSKSRFFVDLNIDKPKQVYISEIKERSHKPSFRLLNIVPFSKFDTLELENRLYTTQALDDSTKYIEWLSKLENKLPTEEMIKAIMSLASVPACSRTLIECRLGSIENLLKIFETALIKPLIAYNLKAGRAITKPTISKENISDTFAQTIEQLDLKSRLEIMEEISKLLIEQNCKSFDPTLLGEVLSELYGQSFEQIIVDIRSQSVFEFDSNGSNKIKFRLNCIKDYFLARSIFNQLIQKYTFDEGLKLLGRYDFSTNNNKLILVFLKYMLEYGDIDFSDKIHTDVTSNFI